MTRDPDMRMSGELLVPRDLSRLVGMPEGVRLGAGP